MSDAADARAAATVVITRSGPAGVEVLMLRRSPQSPVFPGVWVFPGGLVSETDRLAVDPVRAAAVREVAEECGLALDPRALEQMSEWVPPPSAPVRFHTTFYRARAVEGGVLTDGFEVVDHAWVRPDDALEWHSTGVWDFLPPTWVTLSALAGDEPAAASIFHSHVVGTEPTILAWGGDELHPEEPGEVGSRHRITLGPRPWTYRREPGSDARNLRAVHTREDVG